MSDVNVLKIPIDALVVLAGPAGSGKSHFAQRHFASNRVISSDHCRELVSDDPSNQEVSREAFHVMMTIINHRLRQGRLTVADSTGLHPGIRKQFLETAENHERPVVLIAFDTPLERCKQWNKERKQPLPEDVVERQVETFESQKERLRNESYDRVYELTPGDVKKTRVRIQNTSVTSDESGPFDVIGDVHGCLDELKKLLERLGYERNELGYAHPEDRKAVFIGDITDRGPNSVGSLALIMDMVEQGNALYVPGNHCEMLYQYLSGERENPIHGLQSTIDELDDLDEGVRQELKERFMNLYETAPPYLVLDDGDLVVTHAGIREQDIGEVHEEVVQFCLYGDTTGETRPSGFPIRRDWALAYQGDPLVVYGHTPAVKATMVNGTINIDQGAVYGGYLTAFRYPEEECVNVKAERNYRSDKDSSDVLSQQFQRAERRHRTELLDRSVDLTVEDQDPIHISQQVVRRGLDRVSRSDLSMNQLIYLPSEPARGMPTSKDGSNFSECCKEMVSHFDEHDLNKVRVIREEASMVPGVLVCFRNKEAARNRFKTSDVVLMWDKKGRRIPLSADQKEALHDHVFDLPWLIEQESCVVLEGLLNDASFVDQRPQEEWIHRDRFELEEVVNRLQEARSRVGAVDTVLKDLDDIHSNLGQLAEKAFGRGEDIAFPQDSDEGGEAAREREEQSSNVLDTRFFLPTRVVSTDERLLLGTVQEVPTGSNVWIIGDGTVEEEQFTHTFDLDETAERVNQLWTDRPSTVAWWVLPRFDEEVAWNPDLVPAFHLVGRRSWKMSELISPRRWWGKEASAHWAGWNSSKEIFALGRETARRFVGALNPSFVVQTVAAQAGLSHW